MELATYLTSVRRDGDLIAATPIDALERPVPACPEWTIGKLIGHTGWVHRWVTGIVLAPPDAPPSPKSVERAPKGPEVVDWYRQAVDELLVALHAADPTTELSTFIGPRPARWWARRMAHETSVHRWDVQDGLGSPTPIDAELAVDGVEEALDTFVVRRFDHATFGSSGQTLHLHATDCDGEWMLTMTADALTWERGHAKGDTAIRASASDLLLFLMSRRRAEQLELFGDPDLPGRWQAAANF